MWHHFINDVKSKVLFVEAARKVFLQRILLLTTLKAPTTDLKDVNFSLIFWIIDRMKRDIIRLMLAQCRQSGFVFIFILILNGCLAVVKCLYSWKCSKAALKCPQHFTVVGILRVFKRQPYSKLDLVEESWSIFSTSNVFFGFKGEKSHLQPNPHSRVRLIQLDSNLPQPFCPQCP